MLNNLRLGLNKIAFAVMVGGGALLVASCNSLFAGTAGAGNPEVTASLQIHATGMNSLARGLGSVRDSSIEFVDQGGRKYSIHQAYLHLGAIKMEPIVEDDGMEIEQGPFVVDLIHGQSSPELPALKFAPGWYEGVELKVTPIESSEMTQSLPAEFNDASLFVAGTVLDQNGKVRDFKMRLRLSEDWIVGGEDSTYFQGSTQIHVNLNFAKTGMAWDLGKCGANGTSAIFVNTSGESDCAKSAEMFRNALRENSDMSKEDHKE